MGILPSSFFLLFYVTAAIFQLYKKSNSTATYSFIGSLSPNGDILEDVICINLFNNCSNHFRCECGLCSTMDTAEECICCQASLAVSINMEDGDISCITENDMFVANCLNRYVPALKTMQCPLFVFYCCWLGFVVSWAFSLHHFFYYFTSLQQSFSYIKNLILQLPLLSRHTWRCNLH
jgi:hypothetical protein